MNVKGVIKAGVGRLFEQSDQIGRTFASWPIVYYGQYFENSELAQIFGYFCRDM
jgi:hypothetical protein